MLESGVITVRGEQLADSTLLLSVTDNAGLYKAKTDSEGLGMNIVDKRIQNMFGSQFGVAIDFKPGDYTKVNIHLPILEANV